MLLKLQTHAVIVSVCAFLPGVEPWRRFRVIPFPLPCLEALLQRARAVGGILGEFVRTKLPIRPSPAFFASFSLMLLDIVVGAEIGVSAFSAFDMQFATVVPITRHAFRSRSSWGSHFGFAGFADSERDGCLGWGDCNWLCCVWCFFRCESDFCNAVSMVV